MECSSAHCCPGQTIRAGPNVLTRERGNETSEILSAETRTLMESKLSALSLHFSINYWQIQNRLIIAGSLHSVNLLSLWEFSVYHLCWFFTSYRHCWRFKVKVTQSCPTLCNSSDYTVHGILQTRILEWVAIPFFSGSSQPSDWTHVPCTAGRCFTSWATRKPRTLEWVAYRFSSGSSWPRHRTGICCIAGGFFTNQAIREGPSTSQMW